MFTTESFNQENNQKRGKSEQKKQANSELEKIIFVGKRIGCDKSSRKRKDKKCLKSDGAKSPRRNQGLVPEIRRLSVKTMSNEW